VTAVADSSPLIALASISAFQLLQPLVTEIVIPEAVHREVAGEGAGRPGQAEVQAAAWIRVRAVQEVSRVMALSQQFRIRGGEAEAIVLMQDLGAHWLLMDQRLGRQVAVAAGIEPGRLIGTLGILLAAKQRGLIPEVTGKMAELQARGFRIEPGLYRAVRQLAGEEQ
jgi:hypothetical protein